jgi:DNA-binding GntR family transcriptional regulator
MYDFSSSGPDDLMVDRGKPQKLYFQIVEILKEHIEKGGWKIGTQIPTEEQLCSQYSVSRATVRLAIAELVSLGYLKKLQGKGTFVRRKKTGQSITMLSNLGEDNLYQDTFFIARVVENKTLYPDLAVKTFLNLCDGDYCLYILRLIFIERAPLSAQKIYVPGDLLPCSFSAEMNDEIHLYAYFENRYGFKIQRVKEMIDVSRPNERDARLLEVEQNAAALRVRHICYSPSDRPIIFSESIYRTDSFALTSELERTRI